MEKFKKITAACLLFTVILFSAQTACAEDTMQRTFRDSLYGGLIGALIGSAVLLLTDHPDDHLSYIPTGAAVGILAGAAYGVATSGVFETSAAEIKDGKVSFNMPTIHKEEVFDEKANVKEVVEVVNLIRVKF